MASSDRIVRRIRLHEGQRALLADAGRYNVAMMGRRFGKSSLAVDMMTLDLVHGRRAGYWTPVYKDGYEVWQELLRRVGPIVRRSNESLQRIEAITGGVVEFWPLDTYGSGRGRKYHRAYVDEGAKAKPGILGRQWDEVIRPTLSDYRGSAWMFSTPRGKEAFFELWSEARSEDMRARGWRSFHAPSSANPWFAGGDTRDIEEARRRSAAELAEIEADLVARGKLHVWQQEYLAQPADNGVNPFGFDVLERQTQAEVEHGSPVCYGLDIAKERDFTVLVGIDAGGRIVTYERMTKLPYTEQARRLASVAKPGAPILADGTGVGSAVVDMLRSGVPDGKGRGHSTPRLRVIPYVFTASSRQDLLEHWEVLLQDGRAHVLAGQMLTEASRFEYVYRGGRMTYRVPAKGSTGAGDETITDDAVMSVALAYRQWSDMGYPRRAHRPPRPRESRPVSTRLDRW